MRDKHHLLLPEIGGQGIKRLADAEVVVVGAGGLGCPILAYLGAAGVGHLTIIDGDVVETSNLQRQILYTEADVGRPKAIAAAKHLRAQHSGIEVRPVPQMLTAENGLSLIEGADFIVEGIDRIAGRHLINRLSREAKIPLLSSAASRFEGQVALFDPSDANSACYACLVPEEAEEDGLCDRDGVLGPVVGTVGSLAAIETIKFLCGVQPTLTGHMLTADLATGEVRRVALPRDPGCSVCGS